MSVVSRWAIDYVSKIVTRGKTIQSTIIHGTFDVLKKSKYDDTLSVVGNAQGHTTHYQYADREVVRGFTYTQEIFYPDCSLTVPQKYKIDGNVVFDNLLRIELSGKPKPIHKKKYTVRYVHHDGPSGKTSNWSKERTMVKKPDSIHSARDIPLTQGVYDLPTDTDNTRRVTLTKLFADTVYCEIILGPSPSSVYVPCDERYEPLILAEAPEGRINYIWTLTRGIERARFISPTTNRVVQIQLFAPSIEPDDIVVEVSYIDMDGLRKKCDKSFSISQPSRLEVLHERDIPLHRLTNGRWYMAVERHYQVRNQFDQPMLIYGLDVTETLRSIDVDGNMVQWSSGTRRISFNPGNANFVGPNARAVQFEAKSTRTDGEGCFFDTQTLEDIQPFPEETNIIIFQEIQIEGCVVQNNTIHILKDSIHITS